MHFSFYDSHFIFLLSLVCATEKGPIGADLWHPTHWWEKLGTKWRAQYADELRDPTNPEVPLGPKGPLSEQGPVHETQYYGQAEPALTTFATNHYTVHTRGMCYFAPLGPIGPLGALGPLGPGELCFIF